MTIPGEIADALVNALETPAAKDALIHAIEAGEVPLEAGIDVFINGIKASGMIGIVLSATKGSIEAEIKAQFAAYPPAAIAALLIKLAQEEAKALGG